MTTPNIRNEVLEDYESVRFWRGEWRGVRGDKKVESEKFLNK